MTEENRKRNVAQELTRAKECLTSADLLFSHGQLADAVSRLYYHLYHAVRALLLSKGLEPKTHEGALRLLSLHFTKPGILDAETSHIFTRLMKYRKRLTIIPHTFLLRMIMVSSSARPMGCLGRSWTA